MGTAPSLGAPAVNVYRHATVYGSLVYSSAFLNFSIADILRQITICYLGLFCAGWITEWHLLPPPTGRPSDTLLTVTAKNIFYVPGVLREKITPS